MITTFYPPYSFGGDAIYVHRLCTELVNRGHEVDVIHCADSYHLFHHDTSSRTFPASRGITQHKLRSAFGFLSPLLSHQTGLPLLKTADIRRVLASKRFHVIHFHNISLFGAGVLALEPDYPVLKFYTAHDHWLVCPMSVLWKNRTRICDEPACVSCAIRSHRPPQLWRHSGLIERSAGHVDRFLAPSRFCREMHRRRGFHGSMEVLPEFVPLDRAAEDADETAAPRPTTSGAATSGAAADQAEAAKPLRERPYFLFVGRLEKLKGVDEILPHFRGDGAYDLLILGTGTHEAVLRKQAADMPRVRFAGWVGQDQIHRYYRGALAVVVPSITYETFGIVVIEALAHRVPVVVNNLGALPEVAEESGGGLVYNTQEELRGHLDRLARDSGLRAALASRGYQAVLENYSPEAHMGRYESLIQEAWQEKFGAAEPGGPVLARQNTA
jgi:glycosyltransferase involved in cell wall biosynthesis